MYLLVTDETNKIGSETVKFLIYGGLIVPLDKLASLTEGIEQIRTAAGYRPCDELKFDTRARPPQIDSEAATQAKREVIGLCRALQVRFVVQASLHELMKDQADDDQIEFAANTILAAFNKFLTEQSSYGICLVDNLPTKRQWKYLGEKFSVGLNFSNGSTRRLDKILVYGATCVNAGHVNSAVDVVLGTFRYCVNKPLNDAVARPMLKAVMHLMLHKKVGDGLKITDYGLLLRPKQVEAESLRDEYEDLVNHLNLLATEAG